MTDCRDCLVTAEGTATPVVVPVQEAAAKLDKTNRARLFDNPVSSAQQDEHALMLVGAC